MADLEGYGTRNAWAAYDETGKRYFFMHKCDFNEAVNSGKYFLNDPTKKSEIVKEEVKAEEKPFVPEITLSEKGLKRLKVDTKE